MIGLERLAQARAGGDDERPSASARPVIRAGRLGGPIGSQGAPEASNQETSVATEEAAIFLSATRSA